MLPVVLCWLDVLQSERLKLVYEGDRQIRRRDAVPTQPPPTATLAMRWLGNSGSDEQVIEAGRSWKRTAEQVLILNHWVVAKRFVQVLNTKVVDVPSHRLTDAPGDCSGDRFFEVNVDRRSAVSHN